MFLTSCAKHRLKLRQEEVGASSSRTWSSLSQLQ